LAWSSFRAVRKKRDLAALHVKATREKGKGKKRYSPLTSIFSSNKKEGSQKEKKHFCAFKLNMRKRPIERKTGQLHPRPHQHEGAEDRKKKEKEPGTVSIRTGIKKGTGRH